MIDWDFDKIFRVLGEDQGVVRACAEYAPDATPPRLGTVAVWKHRGKIPKQWLPVLVHAVVAKEKAHVLTRVVKASDIEMEELGL